VQLCLWLLILCGVSAAVDKRAITVEDCVRTRRLVRESTILSPDGNAVAYVVKAPDIANNRNSFQLRVRGLAKEGRDNGDLLYEAIDIARIQWTSDGKEVATLVNSSQNSKIQASDPSTHSQRSLVSCSSRIKDFAIDSKGRILVAAVEQPGDAESLRRATAKYGYVIHPGEPVYADLLPKYEIKVIFLPARGPEPVDACGLNSPMVKTIGTLTGTTRVSISPDGRFVAYNHASDYETSSGSGMGLHRLGLYDLQAKTFRDQVASLIDPDFGEFAWAPNGDSFALYARLEHKESGTARTGGEQGKGDFSPVTPGIYAVTIADNSISRVLPDTVASPVYESRLSWNSASDRISVLSQSGKLATVERSGSTWKKPLDALASPDYAHQPLDIAVDAQRVVGVLETGTTPADLFSYDQHSKEVKLLTNLNPEYDEISLGKDEVVQWKNAYGAASSGYLIKPPDFRSGHHYPLIIMAKDWGSGGPSRWFISDTIYQTVFPPQVLANSGFLVVLAGNPDDETQRTQPRGYPGNMGEGYAFMSSIESLIKLLQQRNLIQLHNVGIIGFSRTSWLTDFMLTHSSFKFAAASSADSGSYNYGLYWLFNFPLSVFEEQIGGPPYGKTFKLWLEYSPAFNAHRVQTPLLLEYCGGKDNLKVGPLGGLEFFTALRRQGKPAELFYYPTGEHQLDTPFERVASLQRNVDWFKFWMQDKEDQAPSYDPEQYVRWRQLRQLTRKSGVK